MSVNRSGMDPDRFQMKDLKRRVRALEAAVKVEKKHADRLGVRIATLLKDQTSDKVALLRRIERLESVVSEMHARFPKDLWEQ